MRFAKPLTVLVLATLPLGCPGDDTSPIGEDSSSTGGEESEGSITNATTITTVDPDSSSSGVDPSATTTLTTTDPDTSGSESESSTDPTEGTDSSSSSTDPTDPSTDTGSSTTDPTGATTDTGGSTGASTESSTGNVGDCPDTDLGSVVPQSFLLDTTLADDSFAPSCGGIGGLDQTFSFTAPAAGTYIFTTSRPSTVFDTTLYLLDGDCSGGELACSDDDGTGAQSLAFFDMAADQTVVIVVDGFTAGAFGAAELYIDVVPAAGDGGGCCTAVPDTGGCDTDPVEACVCGFDDACCSVGWTDTCVAEAQNLCNADCSGGVPAEWTCPAGFYNTGFAGDCDCGCGVIDPDCADATVDSCDFCDDAGGCDLAGDCSTIDADDNSICEGGIPAEWTCSAGFYDSGFANDCDCGCGAIDPDCTDATVDSCDFCDDVGGCDLAGDCSTIDAADNSICDVVVAESEELSVGPALGTLVTDGAYNGTLGTMACVSLPLAANGIDTVAGAQLEIGLIATWIGDVTIKVVSPTGTVVTVLSRAGAVELLDNGVDMPYGDSSNTVASSPITFVNGGLTDAETMGATTPALTDNICADDALCVYDPNPGAAVAGDFAAFLGESAVGNWQVCVGDSATPDQPTIDAVTLTIDQN
jgi:hypothetical protein